MIVYTGVLEKLAVAGYTAYRLQKEHIISGGTMDRIRHNLPISTETLDTICNLCHCQPSELMIWQPDPEE